MIQRATRQRWVAGPLIGGLLYLASIPLLRADDVDVRAPTPDIERLLAGEAPESLADLRALEARFREVATRALRCTVGVRVGGAQGSGVIVSAEGHVLTAGHVSGAPGRKVTIVLPDGRTVKGESLGANFDVDAGLIRITDAPPKPETGWEHVEKGKSSTLVKGQWCMVTGHPGGFRPDRTAPVRIGRVLDRRGSIVRTDCMIVGGDSGGPLFDMDARVIGINSRISTSPISNIHVPVDAYHDGWERMVKGEAWGRRFGGNRGGGPARGGPWLGVWKDSEAKDARIERVEDDSPAAKAGIQAGDVITRFDGEEIDTFDTLSGVVRKKKPGDKVKLEVRRGSETVKLEIEIGRYTP